MADPVSVLTSIAVLLLAGALASWVANRLKLPGALLLLVTGMALRQLALNEVPLVSLPNPVVAIVSIIAFVIITFDSMLRLHFNGMDNAEFHGLKLAVLSLILEGGALLFISHYALGLTWTSAALLAVPLVALRPQVGSHRTLALLNAEGVFTTAFALVLPFLLLDIFPIVGGDPALSLVMRLVYGIGAGVVIGLILMALLKRAHESTVSVAFIVSALLSYVLAEQIGGDGVIAVASLGVFFGNSTARGKHPLLRSSAFTKALSLVVFLLLGLTAPVVFTSQFLAGSLVLFVVYLLARFVALSIGMDAPIRERLYSTMSSPKGLATASSVLVFANVGLLSALQYAYQTPQIAQYAIAVMVLSLIVSAAVSAGSRAFLGSA